MNKKLKLNTKKVIILSDDQQNTVQGGNQSQAECATRQILCYTDPGTGCYTDGRCGGTGTGTGNTVNCPPISVVRCIPEGF